MKGWLLLLWVSMALNSTTILDNSTWTFKVSNGCVDVLKFKPNGRATNYDCELDYTFNCTYVLRNDTLTVTEKDDSHSEDGGKVHYYRNKYLIRDNTLQAIAKGELVDHKWKDASIKDTKMNWQRKL